MKLINNIDYKKVKLYCVFRLKRQRIEFFVTMKNGGVDECFPDNNSFVHEEEEMGRMNLK